ncbi:hypothetical protein [Paragemmobacter straminiformis]|uniref:Uncharacterized protein n=1 Tax=Paragemmobacter straminiformis TaxID=2045119 RepID=A0A842ICT0_9RHOB|nr:hypothetical protein [Gemmobacter straminiformis]MBC2837620.1 hypothetical protein [Gemmobacter straminiformis]
MPLTDPDLWNLIRTWPLPYSDEMDDGVTPARRCRRFEDNLRRAGDWTEDAAEEITIAYRQFFYLKALTGETLTPPKWIDAAWHQHLAFPIDYSALEAGIGRKIVHQQQLNKEERKAGWNRGREIWKAEFDEDPPLKMWPPLQVWWRPWAALAVLIIGVPWSVLLVKSEMAGLPPGLLIPFIALFWLSCGCVAVLIYGSPRPDQMSRCG